MSKCVGSCKGFEEACKEAAYDVLTVWSDKIKCRYDGSIYNRRDFILRASHSWGISQCDWSHSRETLFRALREVGATNIIGKVGFNYIDLAFDIKVKALKAYRKEKP